MRRKKILLCLLFLLLFYLNANAQGLAKDTQFIFDKPLYLGYGVQPVVTLIDADLNARADIREEINIVVKSTSSPDGIPVRLVEAMADSGVFRGSFNLDPLKSDSIKTRLRIAYGDSITAVYNNAGNTSVNGTNLTCSSVWKPSSGTVEFSKSLYAGLYSTATLTVKDQDLNLSPSVQDVTDVAITSDKDSKGIVLKLAETGSNTGIFTGSLKFSTGSSSSVNGVIKVGASSTITARYTDLMNSENASSTVVSAGTTFTFTEAEISTSAQNDNGTGNMLDVIIFEPDINNPDRIDTITAKVGAGNSTDDMTLRLEETGANTGMFKQTVGFTDRESNHKLLYMLGMNKVNIKYIDQTVPQGASKEIIKTIGWEYQSTVITLDKENYAGYNTSAKVTLYNLELNNYSGERENLYVDVETNNSKELRLELKETKQSSGIFTGTLYFGRSLDRDDNIIKMTGLDSIFISYTNKRNKSDIAQCSADWSPQDGKLTLDRQAYSGNAAAVTVTLEDWDAAEDSAVMDKINVVARVPGTSRKRSITLIETKRDSGIFAKTFYINGGGDKNPFIELNPGDTLEVAYTDEDTTSGQEETRTVNAVWTGVSKAELTLNQPAYKGFGAEMLVTLKDPDYNKNLNAPDSVEVLVKTSARMNGARYVLKETGGDTGVFCAVLKLTSDWPNYSNVKVNDTDKITVLLVDKNVSATADFSK